MSDGDSPTEFDELVAQAEARFRERREAIIRELREMSREDTP